MSSQEGDDIYIYDKSGVAIHRLQSQGSLRRIATDWLHLQSSTPNNRDVPTDRRLQSDTYDAAAVRGPTTAENQSISPVDVDTRRR